MTTNSATASEHMALHMLKKSGDLTEPFPEFGGAVVHKWDGMKDFFGSGQPGSDSFISQATAAKSHHKCN